MWEENLHVGWCFDFLPYFKIDYYSKVDCLLLFNDDKPMMLYMGQYFFWKMIWIMIFFSMLNLKLLIHVLFFLYCKILCQWLSSKSTKNWKWELNCGFAYYHMLSPLVFVKSKKKMKLHLHTFGSRIICIWKCVSIWQIHLNIVFVAI